jgi:hypothetical protein
VPTKKTARAAYPARFKNVSEVDAFLSIVYALDGDRRMLVQRRREGKATPEEHQLLDDIALGDCDPACTRADRHEAQTAWAY